MSIIVISLFVNNLFANKIVFSEPQTNNLKSKLFV